MRTEVNIARNFKEQTEAYYIAVGGLNKAIFEMVRNEFIPEKISSAADESGNNPIPGNPFSRIEDRPKATEEEESNTDEPRWRINCPIPPVPLGQGQFEVIIGNESGKVDLNKAGEILLKTMLENMDIEQKEKDIIVDSILDWRDDNDLHRLNGAENDYYNSLPEPYDCKDGDFDGIEELLLVRGVTREIFGRLKAMVTVSKPKGTSSKVRGRTKVIPGRFSRAAAEMNKININAASRDMLLSLPSMTEDLVQAILDYRQDADFKSLTDISALLGTDVYNALSPFLTLDLSPFYTITSVGTMNDSKIRSGLEVMIEVGKGFQSGYRIVSWRDRMAFE